MERVNEFLDLLETVVKGNNVDATRIYNIDETGLTTVQKKPRRSLCMKGRSKIFSVSSVDRGVNTTAVCCVSAAGRYVPSVLVYKRDRGCDELKGGAHQAMVLHSTQKSYIKKDCS
jgi:hypothetical protein